ncbi:MAG TPA: FAD-linked oxidase C-terminal domain-containing protein, partial [Fimbriimonas sp.]|nr:FAD-linked oxidase C-terminal domain-containing protein [Fimbriimonas sp.]
MHESMEMDLRGLLGADAVLAGDAASRAYDCDAYTVERSHPTAVVLPSNTEQVAAVVRWCNKNDVPFTARGAGTGLSGGVLPALGGVVISTKRMKSILEIDIPNRRLWAQSGVVNKKISEAVKDHGLHFAPDPSSQTVSTLGGNIAENAGGPHTLKYGVTTQHVLGLTMVNTDGETVRLGSPVSGAPGLDLVGLVVGAEGTLGVVTEALVKLTENPTAVETALIAFPGIREATQTVADIIASGTIPAALEMMDKGVLRAVTMAFSLTYPSSAEALLLVECDGKGPGSVERVEAEMATVRDICQKNGALDIQYAKDEAERARLWVVRKKGIGAMGRLAPSIVTHDGVIPRSKLPEMLDYVYKVASEKKLGIANIFHAGDGNLHPCFYFDDRDPDQVKRVVEAGETIMERCIELGGSITGEHGIGV